MKIDSIGLALKVPSSFRVLNRDKEYGPAYNDHLKYLSIYPASILLVDSTEALNRMSIDSKADYFPINGRTQKEMEETYKKRQEVILRYEYRSKFTRSSIGTLSNFKFIKLEDVITSDLSAFPTQYSTVYVISTKKRTVVVSFHLVSEMDTDAIIETLKVRSAKRKGRDGNNLVIRHIDLLHLLNHLNAFQRS